MRAREWIILRPPEAGWMVLTADFRHIAVPTILTRLDKKPPVLNASGEVGNRVSNFFADFAGKPLRVETCGDQRSIGPARGNFVFNGTATPEIYTLSLHDALPNSGLPW